MTFVRACCVLLLGLWIAGGAVAAARADSHWSDDANAGTVGIISGGVEGTYVRIASDLSAVLDEGDALRVLAVLGKGSLRNIGDILHLKGIDIGIVQSDALAYAKRERLYPNLDNRLRYIAKLYNEEFHVLAGPEAARLEDLAGRKVNFDVAGSGTHMTASLIFETLGIPVEPTTFDQELALEKLRAGEIAALVYVAGKPASLFGDLAAEDGLHFLPVPATPELLETYLPSRLTGADYPGLVEPGQEVETIAVGAVMAVYNWPAGHERRRKVTRFIDAFFGRFDAFLQPPRHAKWKEVNLAAEVPGWQRYDPAEAWLRAHPLPQEVDEPATDAIALRQSFEAFAAERGGLAPEETDALFEEFLRWHNAQAAQ